MLRNALYPPGGVVAVLVGFQQQRTGSDAVGHDRLGFGSHGADARSLRFGVHYSFVGVCHLSLE